jgi:hypothetical protein
MEGLHGIIDALMSCSLARGYPEQMQVARRMEIFWKAVN